MNKAADSGTPPVTVADLELSFGVYEDTNGDAILTPGETGFLYLNIQNNGDQGLVEIMGSVEILDDRLTGWYNEERWWGMAFADSSNTDPNFLTGQSYYGEEVTLDRFDAGASGTRINGTADLYEPCREPDYWMIPTQDEWIVHWCQENKADAFPLYRGPVSLLIENAPSGAEGVSLRSMGVESDSNDNGVAEARETVEWEMRVGLTREGDIENLSGTIRCDDPYLLEPAVRSFTDNDLRQDYDSFDLSVSGTLSPDTPAGHVFTFELEAVDEMGDQFTASATTPAVGASSAQPAFVSVEVTDFFDFTESSTATAGMEVRVENIGGDTIPDAWATLQTEGSSVEIYSEGEVSYGGDISAGAARDFDWYRAVRVHSDRPIEVETPMTIVVTDSLERSWSLDFTWTHYSIPLPVIEFEVVEQSGDGDGVPEPGEVVTFTLLLKKVSRNTPDDESHADLVLSTDDPYLRFAESTATTTPVMEEDDTFEWSVTTTILGAHPGGTVPLTLTADLYNSYGVVRMTTTQPLTFEVTP